MISDRIREIRNQNGLTQTDLGKRLSVTRASVNAWEMGISVPSVQLLVEMSKLFKVTVDYLLDLENSLKIEVGDLTNEQREIIFDIITQFKICNETLEQLSEIKNNNRVVGKQPSLGTPITIDPARLQYADNLKGNTGKKDDK